MMPLSPRTPTPSHPTPSSNAENTFPGLAHDIFPTPQSKSQLSRPPMMRFQDKRAASTPPETTSNGRVRPMRRGTPGDLPSVTTLKQSWENRQLSKKRSQYYGDAFAYREPNNTLKDRVSRDSVIMAELKLSGALDEDTSLVSDFSFHLAQTFQRPESCILVTIQDSTVLLFGGSYEPAYLLTITALASEIAPTKNKRTMALTQDFLYEALGISASRGVVRFTPLAEENFGTNGLTTLGEIEELEQTMNEDNIFIRTISRNRSRKGRKSGLNPLFDQNKTPSSVLTPPHSKEGSEEAKTTSTDQSGPERKRMKRRKSFMTFFGVGI